MTIDLRQAETFLVQALAPWQKAMLMAVVVGGTVLADTFVDANKTLSSYFALSFRSARLFLALKGKLFLSPSFLGKHPGVSRILRWACEEPSGAWSMVAQFNNAPTFVFALQIIFIVNLSQRGDSVETGD